MQDLEQKGMLKRLKSILFSEFSQITHLFQKYIQKNKNSISSTKENDNILKKKRVSLETQRVF